MVQQTSKRRIWAAILLILLLLVQPLQLSLIYISFKINQSYIAKNLCVLKEVEGNDCQGCCQLKKKLKQTEEPESRNLPKWRVQKEIDGYCQRFHSKVTAASEARVSKQNCHLYTLALTSGKLSGVFHPPRI